MRALRVG